MVLHHLTVPPGCASAAIKLKRQQSGLVMQHKHDCNAWFCSWRGSLNSALVILTSTDLTFPISSISSLLSDPPSPSSFVSLPGSVLLPKYSCASPPIFARRPWVCLPPTLQYLWTFLPYLTAVVSACTLTCLLSHRHHSRSQLGRADNCWVLLLAGCSCFPLFHMAYCSRSTSE